MSSFKEGLETKSRGLLFITNNKEAKFNVKDNYCIIIQSPALFINDNNIAMIDNSKTKSMITFTMKTMMK